MAATLNTSDPATQWSQCSIEELNNGFNSGLDLDRCLFNEPTTVVGDPTCGNGIQEEGEETLLNHSLRRKGVFPCGYLLSGGCSAIPS